MTTPALSRRSLLRAAGTLGAATAVAAAVAPAVAAAERGPGRVRDFHGWTQAGIASPPQAHLSFAAIDVRVGDRAALIGLLRDWTEAAARLTHADPVPGGAIPSDPTRVPVDTGEALDLPPAGLTITFGFGPSLFTRSGDPFGIASRRPSGLHDLPAFRGDALIAGRTGGDLCIQACADDAQVAMHAVRNLMRIAGDRARIRWSQTGFNRAAALAPVPTTPRNLFGFRDGTNNPDTGDARAMADIVWARGADGAPWMDGGSYLAVRRIRMLTHTWDDSPLDEQEQVFGRRKADGAPLSGGSERTAPDFARTGPDGKPLIDPASHMALANPANNGGIRILRRAFNYADPTLPDGTPDVGLFFMGYVRDLDRQFIPMQRRLSEQDLLNEYIRHTASAVFAMPPGVPHPGGFIGETLLA